MSKKKEEEDKITFKVITIGDSDVGKTSIIRRYIYNIFDENSMSTVGLNFSFKEIKLKNGMKVNLKLIDTAGQEKYKSLAKSYYKNCDGVLFVFDYSSLRTFEDISEWIKLFEENNGNMNLPKYLVGNKCDLENIVTQEEIDKFLNETKYKFKRTSASKGENIEELFHEITEDIWENYLNSGDKEQKLKLIKKYKAPKKRSNCICAIQSED